MEPTMPPPAEEPAGGAGAGAGAEVDLLRCEVARLQAQLGVEMAARQRLQRVRVVCPECDEMVSLSHTGNAPTPHACTPHSCTPRT